MTREEQIRAYYDALTRHPALLELMQAASGCNSDQIRQAVEILQEGGSDGEE